MGGRLRIYKARSGWCVSAAGLLVARELPNWQAAMSSARAWLRLVELHTS